MRISVIIPIYNTAQYLKQCLDFILCQNIDLEIILVNDGSTDESQQIAEQYKISNKNIKVIHQTHLGPSVARNQGLEVAKGEYIAFVDSDDWIANDSLVKLYNVAIEYQADMVMGNMVYHYLDGRESNIFDIIPSEFKNQVFTGRQCFISLMERGVYYPMACSFICKRKWIEENRLRFDEGIIHEDEVWTQIALCSADKVVLTDLDFYYYRKREGSIMHTLDNKERLNALFHIIDRFTSLAGSYEFKGEEGELKSWIYVNTYRLIRLAYQILAKLDDSRFILPYNTHIDDFKLINEFMQLEAKRRCEVNYVNSKLKEEEYFKWKDNPWNTHTAKLSEEELQKKKLILIYNNPVWGELLPVDKLPNNYTITLDRKYMEQAYAVVFHLPDLYDDIDDELDKPENQIWVAWSMESEENFPWTKDDELKELFDIWMTYRENSDIVCPYYAGIKKEIIPSAINLAEKENKTCMVISSPVNQSKRQEYLAELMKYLPIDSYGKLYNNKNFYEDNGRQTKLDIYSKYKFIIAFENAIGEDYVTEKLYDPLLAGSVPIYLGAPNVENYVPGKNCFINIADFESPKALAEYINSCYQNEDEYMKFHEWRTQDLFSDFVNRVEVQDVDPFIRLCQILDKRDQ